MTYKINRKNDYAFKRIFGAEESKDILARFLSVILDVTIEPEELILIKTDIDGNYLTDKTSVLDIHVQRSNNHERMNIEMQQISSSDMNKRILYYWAKAFSSDLKKGQNYNELPKQITILIADFNLLNGKDQTKYHSIFKLKDDVDDPVFCDALEIHVLELPKLRKNPLKLNALNCWLLYLDNMEGELMREITNNEPLINRAITIEEAFVLAAEERYNYELRERSKADYASAMSCTLQQGIQQGMQKKTYDIAKNMLSFNMSLDDISKVTGLSIEELKNFPHNVDNLS